MYTPPQQKRRASSALHDENVTRLEGQDRTRRQSFCGQPSTVGVKRHIFADVRHSLQQDNCAMLGAVQKFHRIATLIRKAAQKRNNARNVVISFWDVLDERCMDERLAAEVELLEDDLAKYDEPLTELPRLFAEVLRASSKTSLDNSLTTIRQPSDKPQVDMDTMVKHMSSLQVDLSALKEKFEQQQEIQSRFGELDTLCQGVQERLRRLGFMVSEVKGEFEEVAMNLSQHPEFAAEEKPQEALVSGRPNPLEEEPSDDVVKGGTQANDGSGQCDAVGEGEPIASNSTEGSNVHVNARPCESSSGTEAKANAWRKVAVAVTTCNLLKGALGAIAGTAQRLSMLSMKSGGSELILPPEVIKGAFWKPIGDERMVQAPNASQVSSSVNDVEASKTLVPADLEETRLPNAAVRAGAGLGAVAPVDHEADFGVVHEAQRHVVHAGSRAVVTVHPSFIAPGDPFPRPPQGHPPAAFSSSEFPRPRQVQRRAARRGNVELEASDEFLKRPFAHQRVAVSSLSDRLPPIVVSRPKTKFDMDWYSTGKYVPYSKRNVSRPRNDDLGLLGSSRMTLEGVISRRYSKAVRYNDLWPELT